MGATKMKMVMVVTRARMVTTVRTVIVVIMVIITIIRIRTESKSRKAAIQIHMHLDSWTLNATKSLQHWQCCIFASRNEPEVGHEPSSMQLPIALALNRQNGSGLHPRLPKLVETVLPMPQTCPGHAGNWRKMPRIYPNRQGCQR